MTPGILFISLSILFFGISNCLWFYPLKRISFLQLIILRSFLTSIFFFVLMAIQFLTGFPQVLNGKHPVNFSFGVTEILKAITICGFCYFGLYFYILSLKEEKVSIAVPISSISSLFGVLFGVVVLQEKFSPLLALAATGFAFAVYLIDYKPRQTFRLSRGVTYNLAAAFFWGIGFAMFVFPVREIGVVIFSFILEATVCGFSVVLYRIHARRWSLPLKEIDSTILLLAVLGFGGVIFYNLSMIDLPVSLVSAVNVLVPAVSIIFSSILLKEKLRPLQYIGVIIILSCILLLRL